MILKQFTAMRNSGMEQSRRGGSLDSRVNDDTIMIEINGELEPFIPLFLENIRADCHVLDELLQRGDLEEVENMGHRLKGSGGSCGFDAISELGKTIEHAAAARDRGAVARACRELQRYLDRVRVIYV